MCNDEIRLAERIKAFVENMHYNSARERRYAANILQTFYNLRKDRNEKVDRNDLVCATAKNINLSEDVVAQKIRHLVYEIVELTKMNDAVSGKGLTSTYVRSVSILEYFYQKEMQHW